MFVVDLRWLNNDDYKNDDDVADVVGVALLFQAFDVAAGFVALC